MNMKDSERLTDEERKKMEGKKARKKAVKKRNKLVSSYKSNYDKNNALKELSRFELQGNVIDQGWFENLVNGSGKVQPNAIFVLSEIVYWYRPTLVFDEDTGSVIGLKSKFKGDMLQKSYEQLSDKFGLTKRQTKDACKFLEDKGLIILDFRNIKTKSGKEINNVLYIGLNITELKKISVLMNNSINVIEDIKENITPDNDENDNGDDNGISSAVIDNTGSNDPITKKRNRVLRKNVTGSYKKTQQGVTKKRNTNTKITSTEIPSTETSSTSINLSSERSFKVKKPDDFIKDKNRLIDIDNKIKSKGFKSYKDLTHDVILPKENYDYPYSEWVESARKAIWEMYYYDETKIAGRRVASFDVITKLQDLSFDMVYAAIRNVVDSSKSQEIRYPVAFLKTAIFNEIDEFGARTNGQVNFDLNDNE